MAQDANSTLFFQMNPNFGSGPRQVFIFGTEGTTGQVTGGGGFSFDYTLDATGFVAVDVPIAQELGNNVVQDRGFKVTGSAPISGYFLSRAPATTDITFLINQANLGTDHFVSTFDGFTDEQVSVQATQDNTVVTFSPKGGTPFDITLNAGQTYMFTSSSEQTGARVTGDKPIAVFSGNRCTNIGAGACDHIVEQIPSVDKLSSSYVLPLTPNQPATGNVGRVVATQDNTVVRLNGAELGTINAGEFLQFNITGDVIEATAPVLLAQYLAGGNPNADPAMAVVPGQDQWLDSYVFATPSGTADFDRDFITIVIETSDLGSLTVNGTLADTALFGQLRDTMFSLGSIDVSTTTGVFDVTAASPFLLLLSGVESFDSYFTYAGAGFAPGASPPPPPPTPSTTPDVFWDGDGDGNPNNSVVNGGDGVLTANSGNLTGPNGATNNSLPVVPANIIFTGEPGTVTVDDENGAIRAAGLRFRVDGYVITGDGIELAGENGGNAVIETVVIPGGEGTDPIPVSALIESVLSGTSGLTKIGGGTLTLTGVNTYEGGTLVNEGTLVGSHTSFGSGTMSIAELATLVFDQAAAGTYANEISGLGTLIKRGAGMLTIDGVHPFAGGTFVDGGTLRVNGDLGMSFTTVRTGGRLGGTGTVGGLVVATGGRVAPGQSIGTLNVNGPATFQTGSIYELELDSLGNSDRIVATGTGTVDAGAILQLIKIDTPRYNLGTRYTVLTAEGGRTGLFTLTGTTRVSRFIDVVQTSDANNVYLNVNQTSAFNSVAGLTPNQRAAATGADAAANGALFTALAYLQTDAEAAAAFDQISGEVHASARAASFEDSRFIREAIGNRLATSQPGERAMWMHGYGSWGNFDGNGNAADVRRNLGGFFLGGEVVNNDNVAFGILAGYGTGDLRVTARNSTANFEDIHLGAYAGVRAGGFEAKLLLGHMWRDVRTQRNVAFAGFADQLGGNYDLRLFQASADLGYKLPVSETITLEPFGSLAYVSLNASDFREAGGTAALRTAGTGGTDMVFTNLGARVHADISGAGEGKGMKILASAAWRYAGGDGRTAPLRMGFNAGPAFDIAGVPLVRSAAALSLQLAGQVSDKLSLSFGYSGQVANRLSDHGVRGNISLRF